MAVEHQDRIFSVFNPTTRAPDWYVRTRGGMLGAFASLEAAEQALLEMLAQMKSDVPLRHEGQIPACLEGRGICSVIAGGTCAFLGDFSYCPTASAADGEPANE